MIKLLRSFAALLAVLLGVVAPSVPARVAPHFPQVGLLANPALWKVEAPNVTIYLFGTIHLLPADVRFLEGRVASAFGRSTTLVTEILEPTPEQIAPILAAKAMLPAGQSLRDLLAPDERRSFEAALAADGLPAAAFDRFQPWYAAVALATAPLFKMGYDPARGVDAQLGQRAQAAGLPHEALETAEYQLGLFAALPPAVQQAYLRQVLKHLPEVKTELTGIIQAWELGDAGRLARLINDDDDDPQLIQMLLIDRNTMWAKWIQARLAKPAAPHETIFLAVGAGHLAGPGSVIDQLRALGIHSQRLQ